MITLSLLDALAGKLPPQITFGMSTTALIGVLGPTNMTAPRSRRDRRPAILKYGDIEFHFDDAGLWMVFSDTCEVPTGGGDLAVESAWICRGLAIDAAEEHLAREGLPYSRDGLDDGRQRLVVARHGELLFQVPETAEHAAPGLSAFSVVRLGT